VRNFSTFLDKAEVTERVLTVVKDFEKVDAAKVQHYYHLASVFLGSPVSSRFSGCL
jgi:hypothetical protein